MTKLTGLLTATLVLVAAAMPLSANAQQKKAAGGGGGGGHAAAHATGGGGASRGAARFSAGRAATPRFSTRATASRRQAPTARTVQRTNKFQVQSRNRTQRLHDARVNRLRATQPNAQAQLRRNGKARVTLQVARQGRFGARFAARADRHRWRVAHIPAHRGWRRGLRAGFVPWYGPVFWPYAYSDIFDFAFWPGGYDDGYWAFAYDGFFDGVFWGQAGPADAYAYAAPSARQAPRASYAAVQALCQQPGSGVTAWPIADIERKVILNDEQKQLLGDVRSAGEKAAADFKVSCPAETAFPLTPSGRLSAMTARLDATLAAVQTVRPALEKFYGSLSDEQKERFNAIGPKQPKVSAEASQASAQDGGSCKEPKAGLTNLPMEKIEDAVKPTDAQADGLKQLEDATGKAVSIMQAACPDETPITPPGRLEAMEKRLQAMIDAANTVKPALESFYGSLSAEQKARFNRIGRDLAQSGG